MFRGTLIPREFYKVLAYVETGSLRAKGFLLTQNLDQLETLDLDQFKVYQVTLSEIEQRCGLSFPTNLKAADDFVQQLEAVALVDRKPLESLATINW